MSQKQRLLEKYEVPVENLDFGYIKQCTNLTEIERMLEILRSGEEGYYPDLTKCAEHRLHELDSNNRMLRTEIPCQRTTQQLDDELTVASCLSSLSFFSALQHGVKQLFIIDIFRSDQSEGPQSSSRFIPAIGAIS